MVDCRRVRTPGLTCGAQICLVVMGSPLLSLFLSPEKVLAWGSDFLNVSRFSRLRLSLGLVKMDVPF